MCCNDDGGICVSMVLTFFSMRRKVARPEIKKPAILPIMPPLLACFLFFAVARALPPPMPSPAPKCHTLQSPHDCTHENSECYWCFDTSNCHKIHNCHVRKRDCEHPKLPLSERACHAGAISAEVCMGALALLCFGAVVCLSWSTAVALCANFKNRLFNTHKSEYTAVQ